MDRRKRSFQIQVTSSRYRSIIFNYKAWVQIDNYRGIYHVSNEISGRRGTWQVVLIRLVHVAGGTPVEQVRRISAASVALVMRLGTVTHVFV